MSHNTFPVINSTLSPDHLATWASEQYGFGTLTCRVLKTNINHTYLVTTDDKRYILRIYARNHRSYQDVAAEVQLLNDIRNIISVSAPVADTAGNYIHEISAPEGTRYAVLFAVAEGKKVRLLSTTLNHNIGAVAGTFHNYTEGKTIDRTDYTIDHLVSWAHDQLAVYFSEELAEMQFIKTAATVLTETFNSPELSRGIVHLDMWYDNMNITDDGTVTLFDFDNCGNGWLILDIGYYCMQLFYTEPDKAVYKQKETAFLNGYRSVKQLPDNELPLIPYAGLAIWLHYLGVAAKGFNNIGNFYLSENYMKMMIARVKDWLKYHKIEVTH